MVLQVFRHLLDDMPKTSRQLSGGMLFTAGSLQGLDVWRPVRLCKSQALPSVRIGPSGMSSTSGAV
jgi:hypothetical protein